MTAYIMILLPTVHDDILSVCKSSRAFIDKSTSFSTYTTIPVIRLNVLNRPVCRPRRARKCVVIEMLPISR